MKKLLLTIILVVILTGFFLSIEVKKTLAIDIDVAIAPAETPPPVSCCELKHKFKIGDMNYGPGIVGKPGGGYCPQECAYNLKCTTYEQTPYWAGLCALDAITTVADWIKWIAMIVTGVIMVYAGIMFMTATGDPNRASKAKTVLLYGLIGVVIALAAQFLPGLARYFLGI